MDEADILIIGGGSAGCVLAARLSENPGLRVRLIEAGRDTPPGAIPDDIADVFPRAYANPAYFWPDLKAVGRAGSPARPFTQARILGGGSTVMGLWAVRGLPEDYDNWAANGAKGWSYEDVLPFFRKLERDLDIASPEHGGDGPVAIRRIPSAEWPGFNRALAKAASEHGLPLRPDLNARDIGGVFAMPTSTDGERRVSAASAYLSPEVRRRANLDIVTEAAAQVILFEGRRAVGAIVARPGGSVQTIKVRKVVVSAGAIHSPALLLKSGIGPANRLTELGVPVVADSPQVGANLQNHLFVHLGAVVRRGARQSPLQRIYAMAAARISSGFAGAPRGDLFATFIARTSGYATGNRLGIVGASLYAPFSRGRVSLDPARSDGPPAVDFNLLSDPRDAARLLHAAQLARSLLSDDDVRRVTHESFILPPNPPIRLLNRPGLSSLLLGWAIAATVGLGPAARKAALRTALKPGKLLADIRDEREFEELVLAGATPMFHPVGTCALGRVVDGEARVKGVENLRVVDASIMPTIPRGNTNIPTLMIAEKCAAHIGSSLGMQALSLA
ncbi:MAG: GMC family oxidoreductase [Propylenella sp.]